MTPTQNSTIPQQDPDPILIEWQRNREVGADALRLAFPTQPRNPLPLEEFLPSPLEILPSRSGGISITRRLVTDQTPIIGGRQALLRGMRPVTLKLDWPLIIHELREKNVGVWMTDLPEELHQIAVMVREVRTRGRVLVGGLGLGIVAHTLARLPKIREITIVERSAHVIKLIAPHLPPLATVRVIKDDIGHYLKNSRTSFDYYLLDTWQGTSESTWWGEVMPLKRAIRRRWGSKPVVHCWAEDIMAGQVLEKLASARRNWHYERLPPAMSAKEAAFFFTRVGDPAWESKYGKLIKR